ncbi:hypothetical protein F5141DRAFT_1290328 [Pisolithus sp. B1]|nr:hypothetical protein F5141DRAFT_1290328 [Pisolithus sp. B1]
MTVDKRQVQIVPGAPTTTSTSTSTPSSTAGPDTQTSNGSPATGETPLSPDGSPAAGGLSPDTNGEPGTLSTTTTSAAVVSTTMTTSSPVSTYASTNATGSTVVTTATFTTTVSAHSSSSGSTSIAAIVGAAVGGAVVLVVIAFLFYFIRRRSSKKVSDGDFDRVITRSGGGGSLPHLDLSDEANNITPFGAYATDGDEEMRQYGQSSFTSRPSSMGVAGTRAQHQIPNSSVPLTSASCDSDGQLCLQGARGSASGNSPRQSLLAPLPQSAALPAGQYAQPNQPSMYDTAPADWHAPRPGSSLPPSASASSGSAKELEAADERGAYGLGLAPQCEPLERSESPPDPVGGRVVVHQDAGRALEEVDIPQEIPPAYDSIQH